MNINQKQSLVKHVLHHGNDFPSSRFMFSLPEEQRGLGPLFFLITPRCFALSCLRREQFPWLHLHVHTP